MNARKIPVSRVTRGGATGTPDEFDTHFTRQRRKGSGRVQEPQPKLKPLENPSMDERLERVGLETT